MPRLFAAIRPPAIVRDALTDLMEGVSGARWQNDEQLHLTLRFVGEIDRHGAEAVAAALGTVRFAAFSLRIHGLGSFDRRGGGGGALWAGFERSEELLHLQRKIERACQSAGLAPERRAFTPHLTLARGRRGAESHARFLARHAGLTLPPFSVDSFGLFESHLGAGRAHYEMAVRYPAQ